MCGEIHTFPLGKVLIHTTNCFGGNAELPEGDVNCKDQKNGGRKFSMENAALPINIPGVKAS